MADTNRVYFVVASKYNGRRNAHICGAEYGECIGPNWIRDVADIYPFADLNSAKKCMERLNEQYIKDGTYGTRDLESRKELVARTDVCRGEDGTPRAFILDENEYDPYTVQLYPVITPREPNPVPDSFFRERFNTKEEAYEYIDSERDELVKMGFKKEDVDAVMIYEGNLEEYRAFINEHMEVTHGEELSETQKDSFDRAIDHVQCAFSPGETKPWDIGFVNYAGKEDETQLDAATPEELKALWSDMHEEFNAPADSILYIDEGVEYDTIEYEKDAPCRMDDYQSEINNARPAEDDKTILSFPGNHEER